MAWLIGLAEQYEQVAIDIRHLHAKLTVLTPPAEILQIAPTGGFGQIGISEAIREYIVRNGPCSSSQLVKGLEWSRIRTRTTNRSSLVASTLTGMNENRSVRRLGDGIWDVERNPPSNPPKV